MTTPIDSSDLIQDGHFSGGGHLTEDDDQGLAYILNQMKTIPETRMVPALEARVTGDTSFVVPQTAVGASWKLSRPIRVNRFACRANAAWLAGGGLRFGVYQAAGGVDSDAAPLIKEFTHTQAVAAAETLVIDCGELFLRPGLYQLMMAATNATAVSVRSWNTNSHDVLNTNLPLIGGVQQRPTVFSWGAVSGASSFPSSIPLVGGVLTGNANDAGIIHRWFTE